MPLQIEIDGLICHVGDDANHKAMAVLIDESSHKPNIKIEKQFRTDDPTKDFDEKLKKGDLVEFKTVDVASNDLPPGPAATTAKFRRLVPGIERLLEDTDTTKNKLDPLVKSKDKDQKIALVYVAYPGGTLDAIKVVPKKLKFTPAVGTPFEECVADEARLVSTNTKGVIVTVTRRHGGNPLTATVIADAVVRITNREQINSFHTYAGLTLTNKMAAAEPGSACTDEMPESKKADSGLKSVSLKKSSVEVAAVVFPGGPNDPACTNSAWP